MPKQIEIPFNNWSIKALRHKGKCQTSRTKKYGEKGDWFKVDSIIYEITKPPIREPLWLIIQNEYKEEGADSPEELERIFRQILRKGFDKRRWLWVHNFKTKIEMTKKTKLEEILELCKDHNIANTLLDYVVNAEKEAKQRGHDQARLTIQYYREDRDNWASRFLALEKSKSKK